MVSPVKGLHKRWDQLDRQIEGLRPRIRPEVAHQLNRWRSESESLRFHLEDDRGHPPIVAFIGGTGTGKSYLINRILESEVTASSYKRTFTKGPVAIVHHPEQVPGDWLHLPQKIHKASEVPMGETDLLTIVEHRHPVTKRLMLVDATDLDGDKPAHHEEADRIFHWAEAVLFVVTPEKYQMTELMDYYEKAKQYRIPTLCVMNKCEESEPFEDYKEQLIERDLDIPVFAIAREGRDWKPPQHQGIKDLQQHMLEVELPSTKVRKEGVALRCKSLLGGLKTKLLKPLKVDRTEADRLVRAIRAMDAPQPGVDVDPLTRQLQRRMQEQSILYLMGPQRLVQRIGQLPTLLARLPRSAWDMAKGGGSKSANRELPQFEDAPKFDALLADQFTLIQTRVEDLLRSNAQAERWLEVHDESFQEAKIPAGEAKKIVEEELKGLRDWLTEKWSSSPRDTMLIMKLIGKLPGGKKVTALTESAPYLLILILAANHAFFGPIDLIVLGGFNLATWIGEKLSNEVTARTRETNNRIAERFRRLASKQLDQFAEWVDMQAPAQSALDEIEKLSTDISRSL